MQLLTTPFKLEQEFLRLIKQYSNYCWSTAWAGVSSSVFHDLVSKQDCIVKLIVGLHFYQTHPDFIKTFIVNDKVRFIKQPSGTYHPKAYLFYNSTTKWELIVGSANFTNEAFTKNTEASMLISSTDVDANVIFESMMELINRSWEHAAYFSDEELDSYRISWKNHRPKINSLSGKYGGVKLTTKPIHEVAIANLSWSIFVKQIKAEGKAETSNRLGLLTMCHDLFNSVKHFNQLSEDERKFIAGIPNKLDNPDNIDWGWFGSMKGAGIFKNRIKENDPNISKALDQIPLTGQITRSHYDEFLRHYEIACPGKYIATSSRLLAMKRPDTFVCLDDKNKSSLCKDFGIQVSNMTYERYWSDIIERIFDCEWWLNPTPSTPQERKISEARAAFLDALYYDRS